MGYNLIDVELAKEAAGRFLRFFIDKEGGVTMDDCEAFHRRVIPLMEDVDYDYMEVSSPGVDRPLKKPADFERHIGDKIEVRLFKPADGAKTHIGILTGFGGDLFEMRTEDGRTLSFERKKTALVKPVFEFDESLLEMPLEEEEGMDT
ncbi:MAG: ribosome maturation factor RimP [Clostridia bacterium]|nr:ribosome maturation factor RimP [Clostridia bacterium]